MTRGLTLSLQGEKARRVLVGHGTGDDAGVYQLSDELALCVTADFITPVLDDPGLFGEIAAANSLSDVYAMGGRPVTVLNLCCFPRELDGDVAAEILGGADRKVAEAGAVTLGGHSVRNPELLFGLAVTGTVHPARILDNRRATAGQRLVLTKRIGTGVLINGVRNGTVTPELLERAAVDMAVLNRQAAEILLRFGATAATDVTGFGLAGHALNIASASGVALEIEMAAIPRHDGALEAIAAGVKTRSTEPNRLHVAPYLELGRSLTATEATLLVDPQTSGGLLGTVPADQADQAVDALRSAGLAWAAVIGHVMPGPPRLLVS
jgi:selenide,water dikinase